MTSGIIKAQKGKCAWNVDSLSVPVKAYQFGGAGLELQPPSRHVSQSVKIKRTDVIGSEKANVRMLYKKFA